MAKLSHFSKNPLCLWHKKATQAVFDLLQYGLLIQCNIIDTVPWDDENVSNSFNEKESSPYGLELLQSGQCVLHSRTWIHRKRYTDIMDEDGSDEFDNVALRAEYSISRNLLKVDPLINSHLPVLHFEYDCFRHTAPQISDLVVLLRPLMYSREFYQVSSFLTSYIPKMVKKIVLLD